MIDRASDEPASHDPWSEMLGIRPVGDSVPPALAMDLTDDHLNFLQSAHGGAMFTLAETAARTAAETEGDQPLLVDAHLVLTSGGTGGDVLTARVHPTSIGRTLGVYRVEVTRGDGRLVGEMTATFRFR
jgi:acyl-CoA thioesterase